jgi:hypothetical protein
MCNNDLPLTYFSERRRAEKICMSCEPGVLTYSQAKAAKKKQAALRELKRAEEQAERAAANAARNRQRRADRKYRQHLKTLARRAEKAKHINPEWFRKYLRHCSFRRELGRELQRTLTLAEAAQGGLTPSQWETMWASWMQFSRRK